MYILREQYLTKAELANSPHCLSLPPSSLIRPVPTEAAFEAFNGPKHCQDGSLRVQVELRDLSRANDGTSRWLQVQCEGLRLGREAAWSYQFLSWALVQRGLNLHE
jgi:hypothetical protein